MPIHKIREMERVQYEGQHLPLLLPHGSGKRGSSPSCPQRRDSCVERTHPTQVFQINKIYASVKISILNNIPHNQRGSEPLIQELGWPTIEKLFELETVKVVFKALHHETPLYIKELFLKLSDT